MRVNRRAAVLAVACALVLAADPLSWSAGTGAEAPIRPVNGVFALEGHGYGHGRGMSQWGAQGAATLGVPYEQILGTYYPGTALWAQTNARPLRVQISADTDGDLTVAASPGLSVGRSGLALTLPGALGGLAIKKWRVRMDGRTLRLEGQAGNGSWQGLPLFGNSADALAFWSAQPKRLILPGGKQREYRGSLVAAVDAGGRVRTVNEVPMDDYLLSVVPAESAATWRPAALRAQAVAARSYALWHADHSKGFADLCDTSACQVYPGVRALSAAGKVTRTYEAASTTDAVRFTSGRYLTYRGKPAFTEFSSSNGGFSTPGDVPYLPARADPWDGVTGTKEHWWWANVTASRLAAQWPSIGKVTSVQVLSRDGRGEWGGRVTSMRVTGTKGSKTMAGPAFARGAGILHRWFRARP